MKKDNISIKNPLAIIALFVALIECVAVLVISVNFANFHGAWERLPLIGFVVFFPIFVFGAFLYLVIKHPLNLFGPSDFKNQDKYIKAVGKNLKPNKESKPLKTPEKISVKKNSYSFMAFSDKRKDENQRLLIEAALQRYADEKKVEIKTEVRISDRVVCDGVAKKDGELYLFEVKTNYSTSMVASLRRNLACVYEIMSNKGCENLRVVLVLVTEVAMQQEAIDGLDYRLVDISPNIEIVNYVKAELN